MSVQHIDMPARNLHVLLVGAPNGLNCNSPIAAFEALAKPDRLHVSTAATAGTALAALDDESNDFNAILINMDLPDCDGTSLCAKLRSRGVNVPLLILGAQESECVVVRGLEAGASDFIRPAVRLAELFARLRAQIRAYEMSEGASLVIGPFNFRPCMRVLIRRSTSARIPLTEKEAALLLYLYQAGKPVTRTTLLHELWGYNVRATTHTVETHIYRLRRKLLQGRGKMSPLINRDGGYLLLRNWSPTMPAKRMTGDKACMEPQTLCDCSAD